MGKHETNDDEDTWTTVRAYDIAERGAYDGDVIIKDGATGPQDIPYAHDIPFEDLTESQQEEFRKYAIEEFEKDRKRRAEKKTKK